jgi:hypothetical protein
MTPVAPVRMIVKWAKPKIGIVAVFVFEKLLIVKWAVPKTGIVAVSAMRKLRLGVPGLTGHT